MNKKNIYDFHKMQVAGEKITWITSYTYPEAYCAEQAGVDLVLVGDSGTMTTLGRPSTQAATMEEMILLTRAVRRGAPNTFIVFDMPMGSYEKSPEWAVHNAIRAIKETGADAIKLEQATPSILRSIQAIVDSGVVVFGHLGLTPQSAAAYKVQGNTQESLLEIKRGADLLYSCGVKFLLLEAMPEKSAAYIKKSAAKDMVIFGIGAGAKLDGQLLIISDILGYYPNFKPRFAKNYVALAHRPGGFIEQATGAIFDYIKDVKSGSFPDEQHIYPLKNEDLIKYLKDL
jgi:3-methyl-2-oxobutanoate hydroxymethyltransferase